jgi:hypothetical protein
MIIRGKRLFSSFVKYVRPYLIAAERCRTGVDAPVAIIRTYEYRVRNVPVRKQYDDNHTIQPKSSCLVAGVVESLQPKAGRLLYCDKSTTSVINLNLAVGCTAVTWPRSSVVGRVLFLEPSGNFVV